MALAIHFDGLIHQGIVRDYADLARLGGVSRARITQIMNLLNLPPEMQEFLLFKTSDNDGSPSCERRIRGMLSHPLWKQQLARGGFCARN